MTNEAAEKAGAGNHVTAEKPPRAMIEARMQQIRHWQSACSLPCVTSKQTNPAPPQLQGPLGDITNTVGVRIVNLRPPQHCPSPKQSSRPRAATVTSGRSTLP